MGVIPLMEKIKAENNMRNHETFNGILEARSVGVEKSACRAVNGKDFTIWKTRQGFVVSDEIGIREVVQTQTEEDSDFCGNYNGELCYFKISEEGRSFMRALPIRVYRSGRNVRQALSDRYDELLLLCPDGQVEIPLDNIPENLVVMEILDLGFSKHASIRPYAEPTHLGWMGGSNIGYTEDSRFGYEYPLKIYDHQETQEAYDMQFD